MEAGRPDSMSAEKIAAMKEHAVTRVSVNPQSMQETTLERIGRHHSPEDIVCMVHEIRAAMNVHINMDVILGLPGEKTLCTFMDVLAHDLAAAAEDVRTLGLTVGCIYIGGGTPTSLPNDFFAEMLKMVYNAFYG